MASAAVFCMLNPSIADAVKDDPTIRRLRGFSEAWDCNGFVVVNLYALRATDPKALRAHADPVGPFNDDWLYWVAREHREIVCAWGKNARPDRERAAIDIFRRAGAKLWCLELTKDGTPKHPLYLRGDLRPVLYAPVSSNSAAERKEGESWTM